MTIDEAIFNICNLSDNYVLTTVRNIKLREKFRESLNMAIEALNSVNILKQLLDIKNALIEQIKWERDIAINQLEEIGVGFGEKMDDVKEAVDKSKSKKLVCKSDAIYNDGFSRYKEYYCPNCGEIYKDIEDYPYCHWCGQKLEV